MEYSELIQKILTAEHNARQMVRKAREQQASLNAALEQETSTLRSASMERARKRVASIEQEERQQTQAELDALEEQARAALAQADAALERYGGQWADELFRLTVGDGT